MGVTGPKNTDRAHDLLLTLVGLYIDSGEPVSSATLSDAWETSTKERIPASTVRLDLGRLEREGYLVKPHPSGGRIPTVRAYKAYIDSLDTSGQPARLGTPETRLSREVEEACRALSGELRRLLDYAGELLAEESGFLGFVTSPSLADGKIASLNLDPIESDILLLRLTLASGRHYYHLIRLPVPARSFKLEALAQLLTERLSGRSLADISEEEIAALVRHAAQWGRGYDLFVHPLHDLITDARLGENPITVLHGAAGLLKASGEDPETLARAIAFLDDRTNIERTLSAVTKSEGVGVLIGGEGDRKLDPILDGLAVVVASYHVHARARGNLGILGPLRMKYPRQLALVKSVSDLISRVLISRELSPRFG
jgi:heat-inducible transcriptional repressor